MRYNDGFIIGTGAARNIPLGFVPSFVRLLNVTTRATYEAAMAQMVAFNNNGTPDPNAREIKAGMRIDAGDNGWRGTVKEVILQSGAWASGDAAGYLVFEEDTLVGSANLLDNDEIHASEQADLKGAATGFNLAGALVTLGVARPATGAAVAAQTGFVPYFGEEAETAKGFTMPASANADNDLLYYQAWAPDPGSSPVDMSQG